MFDVSRVVDPGSTILNFKGMVCRKILLNQRVTSESEGSFAELAGPPIPFKLDYDF